MGGTSERMRAALHPVRSRILSAIAGADLSPLEIVEALGDVPTGSIYRHLKILEDAGVLEVVGTHGAPGSVHRIYGLPRKQTLLSEEERASIDPETFSALISMLTTMVKARAEWAAPTIKKELATGHVSAMAKTVFLTDAEVSAIREIVTRAYHSEERESDPDCKRRFMSYFLFPG
jgi:DNA-binding transcriptional ArsR family regulator